MTTLIYLKNGGTCGDCKHCRLDEENSRIVCLVKDGFSFKKGTAPPKNLYIQMGKKGVMIQAKCKDKFEPKQQEVSDGF